PHLRRDRRRVVERPAAQPAQRAHDPHHRGHDPVALRRAGGRRPGRVPRPDRGRPPGRRGRRPLMAYTELTYAVDGDVGVITLDRPEARNALTPTTYRELEDAVRRTSARCLVITGADPAFCSGDDVKKIMAPAG